MTATQYLDFLNRTYAKLHKDYEKYFWVSYMGDHSVDARLNAAQKKRDAFNADPKHPARLKEYAKRANPKIKERIGYWLRHFACYQTPPEGLALKQKIDALEAAVAQKRATRKEGYIDPHTKKFVRASLNKIGSMMITHPDEAVRKSCFEAREKYALDFVDEYVELVGLRNAYARALGYDDFYSYKLATVDRLTKDEVFGLFATIYKKTKYAKENIKRLEKDMPGLRKPWNYNYMMSGGFIKEEDPYFPFDEALMRWGRSFAALGIDFRGGRITLDLLDRPGKYNNGFCHYPDVVWYEGAKRHSGSADFTCNVVSGQVGSAHGGYVTLFHEGGHAADRLNSTTEDACMNHEYAPSSVAWSETHSQFLDTMLSSVEWAVRYAKDKEGNPFPFNLYKREVAKLHPVRPLGLNGIIFVAEFERHIYESKRLTRAKAMALAKKMYTKYYERSGDSVYALSVPHLYSFDSSAYYHGYALAELILMQWREFFYKKYGYIVDNPKVGREMIRVWKLGSTKSLQEFIRLATGKKLSADAFIRHATMPMPKILKTAEERIKRLEKVKPYTKPIDLNAKIRMVSGKKLIADNKKGFEAMARKYALWLSRQRA